MSDGENDIDVVVVQVEEHVSDDGSMSGERELKTEVVVHGRGVGLPRARTWRPMTRSKGQRR